MLLAAPQQEKMPLLEFERRTEPSDDWFVEWLYGRFPADPFSMKISLFSNDPTNLLTRKKPLARRSIDAKAERLVSEYLRVWGFRDPETIATLAKAFVQNVRQEMTSNGEEPSRSRFYLAVMQQVKAAISNRVDELARQVASTARDAECQRGLVALELRNLADEYPVEVLEGDLADVAIDRVAVVAQRVVPPVRLKSMPEQPLHSQLAKLTNRWRAGWRGLCSAVLPRLQGDE